MKHRIRPWSLGLALWLLIWAVPALGQTGQSAKAQQSVNINSATTDQLLLLPRIGPAIAQRIVEFREANGSFKAAQELMLVRGIGEKTYQLLVPYIAVKGETTLSEKVLPARTSGSQGTSTDQRDR